MVAKIYGLESAAVASTREGVDDDARELVIRRQAWQFGIVPLRLDDGYLVAATSRRQLPRAVRFATRVLGMAVQFEIADEATLTQLLAHQYPVRGSANPEDGGLPEFLRRAA